MMEKIKGGKEEAALLIANVENRSRIFRFYQELRLGREGEGNKKKR